MQPRYHALFATACLLTTMLGSSGRGAETMPSAALMNPPGLASFTRAIQPLLLNRCAAGACHGGPQAARPQLGRGPIGGRVSRTTTLANLAEVTAAVEQHGGDRAFLLRIFQGHDEVGLPRGRTAAGLLSTREQQLLAAWLRSLPTASSLTVHGKSHPWPFSTWATPENAEGFRGCRSPHPAAGNFFPSLLTPQPASSRGNVTPATFEQPASAPSAEPPAQRKAAAGSPSAAKPNRFHQLFERATAAAELPPPRQTRGLQLEKVLADDLPPPLKQQ